MLSYEEYMEQQRLEHEQKRDKPEILSLTEYMQDNRGLFAVVCIVVGWSVLTFVDYFQEYTALLLMIGVIGTVITWCFRYKLSNKIGATIRCAFVMILLTLIFIWIKEIGDKHGINVIYIFRSLGRMV